jgi:hypothetical protein
MRPLKVFAVKGLTGCDSDKSSSIGKPQDLVKPQAFRHSVYKSLIRLPVRILRQNAT